MMQLLVHIAEGIVVFDLVLLVVLLVVRHFTATDVTDLAGVRDFAAWQREVDSWMAAGR